MPNKVFLCIILSLINYTAFAYTFHCPSIEDIKAHHFGAWVPTYIDGEEMASDQDVQQFRENVAHFALAHWNPDYLESGRCFYEGNDIVFSKMVFAQDAWRPAQDSHWAWVKPEKFAKCNANEVEECQFLS